MNRHFPVSRIFVAVFVAALAAIPNLIAASAPGAAQQIPPREEEQRFAMFDSDGDGRISEIEFELNKVHAFFGRRGEALSGSIDRQVDIRRTDTRLSPSAFDAMDRDGNGVLSGQEVVTADALQFEAIDKNADGFIDRAEFAALVHTLFE